MARNELSALLDEIEAMLEEPPRGGVDAVARVEQTLTDGYARALALEGERWRIEQRLAEVARLVADGGATGVREELAALSAGLERADTSLGRLRNLLASLRRHADAVRAA
ncbi:MAG TPA: hypothetical protein VFL66_04485 [Gaiellaceae bacterium]|nr:hypothetical protein [Gaiellaceae bacterium]